MSWQKDQCGGWFGDKKAEEARWRREKLRAAYHESGHAFWAWFTGGKLLSVNVCAIQECAGQTLTQHPGLNPLLAWDDPAVLDFVRVLLAGVCAEYRGTLELWDLDVGGRQDVIRAMAELVRRGWEGSGGKPWSQYDLTDFFEEFSGGDGGPRREVHQHDAWRCIEALAQGLLERTRLSGQEAVAIILSAWCDDRPLPEKALPIESHGDEKPSKEDKTND